MRMSLGARRVRHYEYVFPNGEMDVYDIDVRHHLIQRVPLPGVAGIRGVAASPRAHAVFIAYGGFGGETGTGSLLMVDLLTEKTVWRRRYGTGVDSLAIGPDGRRIYLPTGEADPSGNWLVVAARDGHLLTRIRAGAGAHNTVVSRTGAQVFLGGRGSNRLAVASTATDRIVRRIGPLIAGVRPFTVDRSGTLAYTEATRFAGFQISSIKTGRVLHTASFGGFGDPVASYTGDAPSHGIVVSPDGGRVWVLDAPHDLVRVFTTPRQQRSAPLQQDEIKLTVRVRGQQQPCTARCVKSGWLQATRNGRYIYVGDSGDVIDTRNNRIVAHLPALERTRQSLEIDWQRGTPIASSSRNGP